METAAATTAPVLRYEYGVDNPLIVPDLLDKSTGPTVVPDREAAVGLLDSNQQSSGRGGLAYKMVDEHGRTTFAVHQAADSSVPYYGNPQELGAYLADRRAFNATDVTSWPAGNVKTRFPGAIVEVRGAMIPDGSNQVPIGMQVSADSDSLATLYARKPQKFDSGTAVRSLSVEALGTGRFDTLEAAVGAATSAANANGVAGLAFREHGRYGFALLDPATSAIVDTATHVALADGAAADQVKFVSSAGRVLEQHSGSLLNRLVVPGAAMLAGGVCLAAAAVGILALAGRMGEVGSSVQRQSDEAFGR